MHRFPPRFLRMSCKLYTKLVLSLSLPAFLIQVASSQVSTTISSAAVAVMATPSTEAIKLGIDVLTERQFDLLQGKRVGLLTHPAGVNRNGVSSILILQSAHNVNLVALYGPEHGIYGKEKASVSISDSIDPRTGLPVYSLHGKHRKPTPEMLKGIDVLVIDLQDIGSRSYTFKSCMKYSIEACFENDVEVVLLDRPNPLGGLKVDGPPLDDEWRSYVGEFPIPYVHGLTIGELARMAVSEPGILGVPNSVREKGKLTVVAMEGWKRYMSWPMTGLRWVPTSPNIPDFQAAVGYSMTGLGAQIGGFSHGIGDQYPFRILSYANAKLDEVEAELRARRIPGIDFERKQFKKDKRWGLYVKVTDWERWRPTELSFHMMQISALFDIDNPFRRVSKEEGDLFNKHVGSSSWWREITEKGVASNLPGFIGAWERQAKQFQIQSRRYWLYD